MSTPLDIYKIRNDFLILKQKYHGFSLAYLDNAATTQKSQFVINSMNDFYQSNYANVHRSIYQLCDNATRFFEAARTKSQNFIHAKHAHECVFVRGTTEGINLVANGFSRTQLKPDDEIIISQIEHHSNIVPWQLACEYTGARLKIIPCNNKGELDLNAFSKLLNKKTKIVAVTHVSNALGTIVPILEIIKLAHANNTPVLIDGAQAAPHLAINVQDLDCDFYTFSAHKIYGPSGIGILYGKEAWLDKLPPYQGGGEMIQSVSFEKTIYNTLPHKFEAGTPAIAEAIGLGAAIDYIQSIGLDKIKHHEERLLAHAMESLSKIPHIQFIGTAAHKSPIVSFILGDIHAHDVGTALDHKGIAVRTGLLCAEPALSRLGVNSVVRASFGIYNTVEEINRLQKALIETYEFFKK